MLYVIATPLGNLEDVSLRALRVLREIDGLACEDTRVTRRIFERYEIPLPPLFFSYQEHNELRAGERVLQLLRDGKNVGLCSDGGCPAISDPGYRVINAALNENLPVNVIPGPCAVETALMASGMPTASFTFHGFLPPKSGKRQNFFLAEKNSPHTAVIYEAPTRLGKTLADAAAVWEDRRAAVCLELTKIHERVERGYLRDCAASFADREVRGEAVIVIAGNNPKFFR
ncbi:ribosomal RNA small subunit methyltransferase I [Planctomycetales bacterium]|nr:ribosomal RNA small subunit methyltransferase I [Planctomycetales bacterium]GHV22368.1 ribosomal RNA small subunit methyltransferase I [Planctomycetales bacterium]